MPTYVYKCPKCGKFDFYQNINDKPLVNCPKCDSEVKKLISGGAGVIYKTDGFYITDSKKNKDTAAS
ncbi:MAG: zinc ribbon domain-containing protein [Firmicutes bacterium]|nr:zinc ribbon domain-containing protein [Bacillota bacterium]MDD4693016.1 zinc ribbon domain-containing protein [Bacillota bacterium]